MSARLFTPGPGDLDKAPSPRLPDQLVFGGYVTREFTLDAQYHCLPCAAAWAMSAGTRLLELRPQFTG